MTFKLRSFFPSASSRGGPPRVPPGYRVYAIGDIHGRLDLLDRLLEQIAADEAGRPGAETVLLFLGDLIDRGPSSAEVVERVRTLDRRGRRVVHLSGNHEEVLLRLLRGEGELIHDWLRFGGAECAKSYGIDVAALRSRGPDEAVRLLREGIPSEHQAFLLDFVDTMRIGDYLFVHAGIRPGVDLADQTQADLRWIREPFLDHDRDHGFVVVHGHTIVDEVDVRANRIGIDTGAYRSGVLTAIALEDTDCRFLQTGAAAGTNAVRPVTARVAPARVV
jgi:serine/threonine protein phosphatase 1